MGSPWRIERRLNSQVRTSQQNTIGDAIHPHAYTHLLSFHTERFSRVNAVLDSLPHEFDEGIGRRGRTPPQGTSPPSFFVVCHSDARVRALHGVVQWLPHTCMRANTHAGIYSPALPYIGSLMSTCCHQRVCLRACVHLLGCAFPYMHACVRSHRVGNQSSAPARR